jgi:hypothetical protein
MASELAGQLLAPTNRLRFVSFFGRFAASSLKPGQGYFVAGSPHFTHSECEKLFQVDMSNRMTRLALGRDKQARPSPNNCGCIIDDLKQRELRYERNIFATFSPRPGLQELFT